jgi:hypothetical protein
VRRLGASLVLAGSLLLPVLPLPGHSAAAAGRVLFVSPSGSDAAAGTEGAPLRSVSKALLALRAGDRLHLRGGVYDERVGGSGSGNFLGLAPGTPTQRITVSAYPGERPVIRGLLWLRDMDYWTFDGINVTWSDRNTPSDHMVRFKDGRGWVFQNGEVWGARSYANINVLSTRAGLPADWALRYNCVHDNIGDPSHGYTKDQLLYVNTGVTAGPGTIERNLLFNAPRGKAVKLAGPDPGTGSANVVVRFNTMYGTYKPSVVVGYTTKNTQIYRNLVARTQDFTLIRGYELVGTGNWARDNAGFAGPRLVASDKGFPESVADLGGNISADPRFDATTSCAGFHPTNPAAQDYGRYAS